MQTLGYYLTRAPLSKGNFMARTVTNGIYSDKELISEIVNKNSERTENEVKEFLKEMVAAAEKLLSLGYAISIPNFLRISPAVKGIFYSPDDMFNTSKNWVAVNCSVSTTFVDNFQKKVKVEKRSKPNNWPDILAVYDNKTKENVIQKNYANLISGDFLTVSGSEFDGITLISKADNSLSAAIEKKELDVISHKTKELSFNIRQAFTPPVWLTEGAEIFIKLRYKPLETAMTIDCEPFETKWSCVE